MRFIPLISSMLAWACVGTVALEAASLGIMWRRGVLTASKVDHVVAVMYGVDVRTLQEELEDDDVADDVELASFEEISNARDLISLDLDLREMAIDKAQVSQNYFRTHLDRQKEQYRDTRKRFEDRRKEFLGAATDEGLLEVQETLISLPAADAKDEILLMLDGDLGTGQAMNDLVAIIKSMALEKRKKILAQFKTPAEEQQLGDILKNIRSGMPHVDLIQKTRKQLQQGSSREKGDSNGIDTI